MGAHLRARTELGAVLVETAIVALVLLTISFGIVEFGLLMRQVNEAASSVRSGVRVATSSGSDANADLNILQSMKNSNVGLSGEITEVMIFRADSATGRPIGPCQNFQPTPNNCNVYDASDVDNPGVVSSKANSWQSSTRISGVDYIGISIRGEHTFITNFFGESQNFTDSSVVRLDSALPSGGSSSDRIDGITNGGDSVPPKGTNIPYPECGLCTPKGDAPGKNV